MKHTCAAGSCITPQALINALSQTGLRWRMTSAQYAAICRWNVEQVLPATTASPLLGIPIDVDDTMRVDHIELRIGPIVLHQITNLAVPNDFYIDFFTYKMDPQEESLDLQAIEDYVDREV